MTASPNAPTLLPDAHAPATTSLHTRYRKFRLNSRRNRDHVIRLDIAQSLGVWTSGNERTGGAETQGNQVRCQPPEYRRQLGQASPTHGPSLLPLGRTRRVPGSTMISERCHCRLNLVLVVAGPEVVVRPASSRATRTDHLAPDRRSTHRSQCVVGSSWEPCPRATPSDRLGEYR